MDLLLPENYPASSYCFTWADIVAYGESKYAYDYSSLVGRAAIANYPAERLMPVIKCTFEVKQDKTYNGSFPAMSFVAQTAQLCGLYDAGIRHVYKWDYVRPYSNRKVP